MGLSVRARLSFLENNQASWYPHFAGEDTESQGNDWPKTSWPVRGRAGLAPDVISGPHCPPSRSYPLVSSKKFLPWGLAF